ncbi:urease accessory protein UreE [Cognatishimia sp. F0-27]|uniref:urease accessory protein UreE n=1 Tax=Cognatishimia sp. F0-27 TaxID=2816855 RepID=UPI001D0C978A|nr:urease accessory protein UreE [Cognatishimia sp. F0-27]MCC1491981.1 urease accessory protein UreE [Cognatishimia sp. F0-27]
MLTATRYHPHAHGTPFATLSLSYEARFLRRRVLQTDDGMPFLLDLPQTTSLDHGGVVICEDQREIEILAAPEKLLEVRAMNAETGASKGPATGSLVRLAWHIGNRHTPCQIEADRLLIQPDHVIAKMLQQLGALVRDVHEPFTPEGGAYGHGRTHGHSHGDAHGHSHPHAQDHGHGHSHTHGHPHDPTNEHQDHSHGPTHVP